jgi:hypothetical protein
MAMLNILSLYEDFSNHAIILINISNATLQYTPLVGHTAVHPDSLHLLLDMCMFQYVWIYAHH